MNLWNAQETDHKVLWIQTCADAKLPGKFAFHRRSEKKNIPHLSKGDAAQKTLGTANKLILHVLFPEDVNWWAQLKAKLILKLAI